MSLRRHGTTSDRLFHAVCAFGVALPLVFGAWFVVDTLQRAWPGLSNPTFRFGLLAALLQSARVVGFALALALPIGIAAAIHIEHLASQRFFTSLARRSIALLAAVPSVLYGLFGLTLLTMVLDVRSIFVTTSITLALFLFPMVVERSRSALRTVPPFVHEASLALGADPWRALVHVVLPLAIPKLAAEVLLIVARALGTVAPLLVVGLLMPAPKVLVIEPLAVRIFESVTSPDPAHQTIAAAAVIALLLVVVVLHVLANWVANRGTSNTRRFTDDGLSERGIA
jgi:phosphate transport system permease protein